MSQRDKIIVQKILQYCKDVDAIIKRFGDDIQIYVSDIAYQYACSMCIIQIGELVGQLSDDFKNERREVPWKLIKDMRNIFAHDYSRVDNGIVWDTLKRSIPDLQNKCEKILGDALRE